MANVCECEFPAPDRDGICMQCELPAHYSKDAEGDLLRWLRWFRETPVQQQGENDG